MNTNSIFDSFNYPNKSVSLQIADDILTPLRIACNRRCIELDKDTTEKEVDTEKKTHHVGLRIIAALTVIVTFPLTLIALAVKWLKKEELQTVALQNLEHNESESPILIESPKEEGERKNISEKKAEFAELIQKELACVHDLDKKLPEPEEGSWRAYGEQIDEFNQTLSDYISMRGEWCIWPDRDPLYIQQLGAFSEVDLRIISITSDYLKIFHNLPIKFCKTVLTMEQLKDKYLEILREKIHEPRLTDKEKKRGIMREKYYEKIQKQMNDSFPRTNGQYDAELALDCMKFALTSKMKEESKENVDIIAFTNEDLFTPQLTNFVFGCGRLFGGEGIWSKARFGDPSEGPEAFQKALLRMMKISAHEFGHMRMLTHCTDYECNIGGYMSLTELDERPLLYCLQDMAKICYLTETNMLDQHKRILKFFQNFNENYKLNIDFSKEIGVLNQRIEALTSI